MHVTMNRMQGINFARTYQWDIYFLDAPAPFNKWFPADSVTEPLASVNTHTIMQNITPIEFPKDKGAMTLRIDMYDDMHLSLQKWLVRWMNQGIFDVNGFVLPLRSAVKQVWIGKYRPGAESWITTQKYVYERRYSVFPKGIFNDQSDSESKARKYSVEFAVCGIQDVNLYNSGRQ